MLSFGGEFGLAITTPGLLEIQTQTASQPVTLSSYVQDIDPRGRPTVTAGSDHYFRTCCLYIRPSVPTFQNLAKQNVQARIVIATGGTVDLAGWIIDDKHVLFFCR